jgi:hypothetical protein
MLQTMPLEVLSRITRYLSGADLACLTATCATLFKLKQGLIQALPEGTLLAQRDIGDYPKMIAWCQDSYQLVTFLGKTMSVYSLQDLHFTCRTITRLFCAWHEKLASKTTLPSFLMQT